MSGGRKTCFLLIGIRNPPSRHFTRTPFVTFGAKLLIPRGDDWHQTTRRWSHNRGEQSNREAFTMSTEAVADLTPSQTISSSNQGASATNNNNNNAASRRRSRNRAAGGNKKQKEPNVQHDEDTEGSKPMKQQSRRRRPPKKKTGKAKQPPPENTNAEENGKSPARKGPNKRGKRKKKTNNRKNYPWRKHIPADSVDPITLDPLQSLPYPPFALVAAEPYDPVQVWPIAQANEEESKNSVVETEEERERRILEEQWGKKVEVKDGDSEKKAAPEPPKKRHYHLYDGRALAYWMAASNQFIDPLNRRDLTRDELVNLDHYLHCHGFDNLNVTEAFDAKGITISTASAAGNTPEGRAAILRQEASILLNSLFGNTSVAQAPRPATNSLMAQYQAHEQSQQQQQQSSRRPPQDRPTVSEPEDVGIYGEEGGIVVVDDDLNPGLRGAAPEFIPLSQSHESYPSAPTTLYSASHIAARYGHSARVKEHEFPSLSAVSPVPAASQSEEAKPKKPLPKAKTLSKIGGAVKKTDPEELQRQWEAREEARRRAMMSNLTFGQNHAASNTEQQVIGLPLKLSGAAPPPAPTEAQLERNRALAEALDVKPASARSNLLSGWARPTETRVELDEFGNELNATLYPESLISHARECMGPLLKLEKKWKKFLADDTSASLPLNAMDRPMRTFVHEYSGYWKLHTESFDREPKRYIHCVKLRDTSAPCPLLSDAARNWRGPRPMIRGVSAGSLSDHVQQTAGQSTSGREIPPPPERTPLPLKPRSVAPGTETATPNSGPAISGAPTRSMEEAGAPVSSRFAALSVERERPKLQLQKRTLPTELPPFGQPSKFDVSEDLSRQKQRMEEKARKEREKVEQQRRASEAAFASDDENGGDASSEWEEAEEEQFYSGSDEEDSS